MKNAAPNIGAAFLFPGGALVRRGQPLQAEGRVGFDPPTVHLSNRGLAAAAHWSSNGNT